MQGRNAEPRLSGTREAAGRPSDDGGGSTRSDVRPAHDTCCRGPGRSRPWALDRQCPTRDATRGLDLMEREDARCGGGERRTRAEPGRQKSLLRREDVDSWERGLRGERHPGAGL